MDEKIKKNLSEKIRFFRNKLGYTQEYMAHAMGKSDHTAYQRIETGRTEIKLEDFVKLARIFQVAIEDLLDVDGVPHYEAKMDLREIPDVPYTIHLNGDNEKLEAQIELARKLNEVLKYKK